ncbi:Replication factor C, subunit 3 [Spironucleus salmonicida]|uniref:Replication factor C, subunit 3 n=1 Tax=Spironucleus salmonicida TaxID=348837 RepID=V6M120_9EUKA|nr:Replication factor C, subunit 3 [Spironucleus salmonicida]KAH0575324.1 Replication factor C, subunit 3 [Spironucleus salmonicida]|eukprot:EST46864.1 Replication factor C, subunit 3 [Spironucleus salmonicida]
MSLPFTEKYRPRTFDEIHSHARIKAQLTRFVAQGQLPHLLFFGPPGTGKTTTVHALARMLFGDAFRARILELNASDENGIDAVREKIIGFVRAKSLFQASAEGGLAGLKLIVLDECDQMSGVAQGALRRVMETASHTARFVLLCNYPQKLIPPLLSRTAKFRFRPVATEFSSGYLQGICEREAYAVPAAFCAAVCDICAGDLRASVNLLQHAISLRVSTLAGLVALSAKPAWSAILRLAEPSSFREKHAQVQDIVAAGVSVDDLVAELLRLDLAPKQIVGLGEIDEGCCLGAETGSLVAGIAGVLMG